MLLAARDHLRPRGRPLHRRGTAALTELVGAGRRHAPRGDARRDDVGGRLRARARSSAASSCSTGRIRSSSSTSSRSCSCCRCWSASSSCRRRCATASPSGSRPRRVGAPRDGTGDLWSRVARRVLLLLRAPPSSSRSARPIAIVLLGVSNQLVAALVAVCFLEHVRARPGRPARPVRSGGDAAPASSCSPPASPVSSQALLTDSRALFVVGALVGGFGQGLAYLGGQSLVEKAAPPEQRSEVFSLYMIVHLPERRHHRDLVRPDREADRARLGGAPVRDIRRRLGHGGRRDAPVGDPCAYREIRCCAGGVARRLEIASRRSPTRSIDAALVSRSMVRTSTIRPWSLPDRKEHDGSHEDHRARRQLGQELRRRGAAGACGGPARRSGTSTVSTSSRWDCGARTSLSGARTCASRS